MTGDSWRREAERLAWWAWLVCPDPRLAVRLADYRGPVPPWLGTTALFVLGSATGLLAALLLVVALPDTVPWRTEALVILVVMHFAGTLLARTEDEKPAMFPARVSASLLHAPYVVLAAVAWLNLWETFAGRVGIGLVGVRDGPSPEFALILTGLGLLVLLDMVICGPQVFGGSQESGVSGASFMFRFVALLGFVGALLVQQGLVVHDQMRSLSLGQKLFGSYPVLPELRLGLILAIGAVILLRPYELACERLGELLFGGPSARSRKWPSWLGPPTLGFESLLLRSPQSSDWSLAIDLAMANGCTPARMVAIGQRAWRGGHGSPAQVRLAALAAGVVWQTAPDAERETGWELLEAILRSQNAALDAAFWAWLGGVARLRRAELLRWILRERRALAMPRRDLLGMLRPLRWTMVLDTLERDGQRELVGQVLDLVGEVRSVALLEQILRDLDAWRETQLEPHAVVDPQLLARWTRAILDAGPSPGDPVLAHAATLRRTALRAAAGDSHALRTWYALARRFEDLPASRQRDVLHPFGYRELWRMVLERHDDAEEQMRQDERYQRSREVRVRRPSGRVEAPE